MLTNNITQLKFYNWYWKFFKTCILNFENNPNLQKSSIIIKNKINLFYFVSRASVLKEFKCSFYWVHVWSFF